MGGVAFSIMRRFVFLWFTSIAWLFFGAFAIGGDVAISQQIDRFVESNLKRHKLESNPPVDDITFVRRVYLNIAGRIPTTEELDAFLQSDAAGKRRKLIHRLLNSKAHASHMFNYWADILRIQSRMEGRSGEAYAAWVKEALRTNKPYDKMVLELLTSEGFVWENGAVGYYMRDAGMPLDNMSNTVQVFLGTRMVCAQCHNHPFDRWKQKEYYEMAAYTYGIDTRSNPVKLIGLNKKLDRDDARNRNRKRKRMRYDRHVREALNDILEPLRYQVSEDKDRELKLPHDYQYNDGKPEDKVNPDTPFGAKVGSGGKSPRTTYAKWLTSPENPRFTKVIVNRMWKHVFGIGLFEPVDDLKDSTVASNSKLLAYLEREMKAMDYDLRRFLAVLYNTRTYQRQVTREEVTLEKPYHFPGPILRRLTAEQIWDSMLTAAMPAVDDRTGRDKYKKYFEEKKKEVAVLLERAEHPEEILEEAERTAKIEREFDRIEREVRDKSAKAREAGDQPRVKELRRQLDAARKDRKRRLDSLKEELVKKRSSMASTSRASNSMMMSMRKSVQSSPKKERSNSVWAGFPSDWVRASELRSPAPGGHFLREFGQSDRDTIQNAHQEASVTQALSLMNGSLCSKMTSDHSQLTKRISAAESIGAKQDTLFKALLGRLPKDHEREAVQKIHANRGEDTWDSVVWALLNSREFYFIQ